MRHWLTMTSMLLLLACASTTSKTAVTVQIEGLKIENQTRMWVSAARLMIPATGGFVSCGNIAPGSMCSTGFPEINYSGNPVEITWSQSGQIHSTGEFEIIIPSSIDLEKSAMVHVIITGPGAAGAALIQQP